MKRFVWRLQQVLDVRAAQEEQQRAELVKLADALARKRNELWRRQKAVRDLAAAIAGRAARQRLGEQELFLKCAAEDDRQLKQIAGHVAELESRQKAKIAELLETKKSKQALQKLREEARKRFLIEQDRLEQKQLDERNLITFAQTHAPSGRKTNGEHGSDSGEIR